ncbi:Mediator of RNA polymerase II transcription subunit 7 [Pseudocyphellaria aurata]|nr:Mediator of RNA polymerase II transcription subunit 7 [Pseudocyphellaria aurata]
MDSNTINPAANLNSNNPAATISAAFPAPPPFYKSFTEENLALLAAATAGDARQDETTGAGLPQQVQHLIPPAPPRDGKYRSFGVVHDVPPQPETPQLQSQPPTPQRLLAITHNILLTFLTLTHALASAPSAYAPVWDQLHALFQEAHAIVNDYRPHQARETLILMMEDQVAKGRAEVRGAREMGARVKAVLEGLGGGLEDSRDMGMRSGRRDHGVRGADTEDEETRRVWETIGREVGFV